MRPSERPGELAGADGESGPRVAVITWNPHHRTTSLARVLGAQLHEPRPVWRAAPAPARYVLQALQTVALLIRRRPRVVVFQNPPAVLGALLVALRRPLRYDVWPDTHSGVFNDPRWSRLRRLNRYVFSRSAGTIVHTPVLAPHARAQGANPVVLAYPIPQAPALALGERSHIVVTLAYAPDEPVELILRAAAAAPEAQLVLTGRAPAELIARAPANCRFSGWLARADYEALLDRACGVVCLTTRDETMQTGGFEALERGLALVTSDFPALRDFHREGALFVGGEDPRQLTEALRTVWTGAAELRAAAARQRERFLSDARAECEQVRAAMGLGHRRIAMPGAQGPSGGRDSRHAPA